MADIARLTFESIVKTVGVKNLVLAEPWMKQLPRRAARPTVVGA